MYKRQSVGVGSGVAAASSCGVGVVCVMAPVGVPDGSSSLPHALTAKSARTQSRKAIDVYKRQALESAIQIS